MKHKMIGRRPFNAAVGLVSLFWAASATAGETGVSCPPSVFKTALNFPATSQIDALATADFNGDGYEDLAVGSGQFGFGLYVMLGDASGGFGAPQLVSNPLTNEIVVGDFNGDHKSDIIAGSGQLYFYAGNGDGTFQPPQPVISGPDQPVAVLLDSDSKLDLVLVDGSNIVVLLGNGDGTFQPPSSYPAGFPVYHMAIRDVNNDGKPDVVATTGAFGQTISVLLGNGDGSFAGPMFANWNDVAGSPVLADFNSDGKVDLAFLSGSGLLLMFGNGDGTFQNAVPVPIPVVPTSILAADFDGDGKSDIAVESVDGDVTILLGVGDGTFTIAGTYVGGSVIADRLGSSNAVDLIFATSDPPAVSVLAGVGDGRFLGSPVSAPGLPGLLGMTIGDFNEDGLPDVAVGTYGDSQTDDLYTLSGKHDGSFTVANQYAFGQRLFNLAVADFDGDGHLDLLITGELDPLFLLSGHGDGTFGPKVDVSNAAGYPSNPVVADLNGDGKLDFVVAGQGSSGPEIVSFLGDGHGAFPTIVERSIPAYPLRAATADFNGDGKPDLALTTNDGLLNVFLGIGDGSFSSPTTYSLNGHGVITADFNGDGKTDIATANGANGTVSVLLGNGDGTFDVRTIGVGWETDAIAAADFDGDGHLDILTANSSGANVVLLRGRGDGTFDSPVSFDSGAGPVALSVADLLGNGTPDVVVGNGFSVTSLLNARLAARLDSPASVVVGASMQLTVRASGFGTLTYQWRKGGTPLSDGGAISGSHTVTLTIDPVSFADAGSYDVIVTDSCTSVTSNAATLSVEFADVPLSSLFHNDIIKVATAGITAGCGGGNYCPTNPVRRDQMAVFLLKAEHGSTYAPPACSGAFADVPCPGPFTDWVERLAAEGITGGCGGGDYCPGNPVTRAQMAILLLKTKLGSSYAPPPAVGIFGDVPVGSFAADFIEDLYNRGITGGCSASPLLYCPNNPVNRGQMATFLVRTFLTP